MVGELGAHMKMSIGDSIVKEDVINKGVRKRTSIQLSSS